MTKRCPISYLQIGENESYHPAGLKLLSPKLATLNKLPFDAKELRIEATKHADKLSIQGVQYKLSAILNIKDHQFEFVDNKGKYILKPQSDTYKQLPENEDLSMRLAKTVGIEVPVHGLVYNKDDSFTYFIKRFDRIRHKDKLAVEDFSQLTGRNRETKYNSSMEKVVDVIENFCTFPLLEKKKLFERVLFNYLIGNEDMHLKNFALISRNNKIELAPAFDFVNSTIVLNNAKEELALPLNGKKRNLTRKDLVDYYAKEGLGLSTATIQEVLESFCLAQQDWPIMIEASFLDQAMKERYLNLVQSRSRTVGT
jgi:serine/threonine-protein kinase HipA